MLPEFQPPSVAVAVWVVLSLFVQVTLPPRPTVMGLGANAVAVKIEAPLTMETGVPPALGDGDEGVVVDEDELPHAVRNRINPVTDNKRTIMWASQADRRPAVILPNRAPGGNVRLLDDWALELGRFSYANAQAFRVQ